MTRYYGGTKLGTGGLSRAYGEAAGLALEAAPTAERVDRTDVVLRFPFADTAVALRVARRFQGEFGAPEYDGAGATLAVRVPTSQCGALAAAFVEATSGRGDVRRPDSGR